MLNTCQDKTRQKTIQTSFFGDFPSTNDTFKETLFKQGVFTPRENISTHSLVSKHWHETVNEHIVTPIKEIDRRLRQPVLNGIYSIEHAKELEQFWSKTRKEKITFFLPALDIYFFKCFQDGLKDLSEEELIDFFLTPSSYADEDEEEIVEAIECSVDALLNDTIIQALFEGLFVIHPIIYGDVVPINRLSDVLNRYGLEKLRVYINESLIAPEEICFLSYEKLKFILAPDNFSYDFLQVQGIDHLKKMDSNTVREMRRNEQTIFNIFNLIDKTSDPVSAGDIFLHSLKEGLVEIDELIRFSPQQLEQLFLTDYGEEWLSEGFSIGAVYRSWNGVIILEEDGFETIDGVYTYSEVVDFKLAERKEYYEQNSLKTGIDKLNIKI